jgi:HD-GYP domain-containing protein (c-di-GMP phosphodiesterase class II)
VWARLYIEAFGLVSLLLLCALVYLHAVVPALRPTGVFSWASFAFLLLLAVFAEVCTVRLGSGVELSASFLACFLSGAIAGPLASFCVAVGSQMYHFRRRQWERNLCFAATAGLLGGGTSLLYWGILSGIGGFKGAQEWVLPLVGLTAGVFYPLLNFGLVAPIAYLRRGVGVGQLWREGVKPFLPFHLFFLTISLGLISLYQHYLPATGGSGLYSSLMVGLFLIPVVGLIYVFRAYAQQRDLARHNARLAARNERLAVQAVASQVMALDLKDDYTAQHSAAVAQWAADIAKAMGMSEREVNLTHSASLLHDVGKIGVPDELLKSPKRLDADNLALVEGHCLHGHQILKQIDQFRELATVVLYHHERFDGTGYPHGLAGGQIPLSSRIISVVDSYHAMISDRPYGPPLPEAIAQAELEFKKGTQFDPEVVDVFLSILEKRDKAYRLGRNADFHMEMQAIKFQHDLLPESEDAEPVAPPAQARDEEGIRSVKRLPARAAPAREAREKAGRKTGEKAGERAGRKKTRDTRTSV